MLWSWLELQGMNPEQTRAHAAREEPGRAIADTVLVLASVASIGGVAVLLVAAQHGENAVIEAAAGVAGVAASWLLVHTLYVGRYARLYFQLTDEPVDFGGEEPDFRDFYYLAFTIGMAYQVSDTSLRAREMRRLALGHSLIAYLLGAVVVASTVNLLVQLAG